LTTAAAAVRIIELDDEPDILRVVELSLRRWGYDVKSFTGPVVALEHFKNNASKCSLIIPDVKMPSMTGSELAKRAKKIKPDIRVRSVAKKQKLDAKNSIKDGTASFVGLGASSRPTFLRSHTWMPSATFW
jgi:DNA-binding NtrC family response regulator